MSVAAASTAFVQCRQEIPVTATVTNAKTGRPISGFLVNFRVLDGGGSIFGGAEQTDSKGQAKDYWSVGSGANLENTLEVRAVDPTTGAKYTYFSQTVTTLSKIAFVSDRDASTLDIYVMNADGTGVTRLTNNAVTDFSPAWSPDGRKIAFVRGIFNGISTVSDEVTS